MRRGRGHPRRREVRHRFDEPVVVTVLVEQEGARDPSREAGLGLLGFVGGLAIGLALWSRQMRRYRRDLFSDNPVRRYAALGYVAARPSNATARVLHDYVAWERRPSLRTRAERALRRMEDALTARDS